MNCSAHLCAWPASRHICRYETLMSDEPASVLVDAGPPAWRKTIRTTLSPPGFVFEEATSDLEATARVLRGSYNLVLIGWNENGCGGFETCRHLRAISPNLGIVLISSGGALQDEIRALEAGADDCVSIPFRFRGIVGRLGAVLRRPNVDTGAAGTILRIGDI